MKFSISLSFYLFAFVINLWHRTFVTEDVTAVFATRTRFWFKKKILF